MASSFKVLVIATNVEKDPFPVYPLGASLVAGALERAGIEVRAVDLGFDDAPEARVASLAVETAPDLVAVSVRAVDNTNCIEPASYLPAIEEVVRAVKRAVPAPVVLGGPGYSLLPREILEQFGADYGVQGEGERTVVRLVKSLEAGQAPEAGNGLWVRSREGARGGPADEYLPPEAWAGPDYRHFPLDPYLAAGGTASIQTKRGCLQKCCYCTYPFLEGRNLRLRDPREVAREVVRVTETGARYYYFVDNTFNLPAEHALEVCREVASLEVTPHWTAFVAPLGFPAELAPAMARAGCRSAEVGSEGGTATLLREIGKGHTVAEIVDTDRFLFEAGVTPAHFFIFGGPGETPDSVEESLELIDRLSGVSVAMPGLRIYPGTALFGRALHEKVLSRDHDMTRPVFYRAPGIDHEWLIERLKNHAADHPRFFISGLDLNVNQPVIDRLRKKGRAGPLWEFFNVGR